MMLMPASFYSSSIVQLSWISGSLAQPAVKRAAAIALINCICNTPNSEFHPSPFPNLYSRYSTSLDRIPLLRFTSLRDRLCSQPRSCCSGDRLRNAYIFLLEETEFEDGSGPTSGQERTDRETAGCGLQVFVIGANAVLSGESGYWRTPKCGVAHQLNTSTRGGPAITHLELTMEHRLLFRSARSRIDHRLFKTKLFRSILRLIHSLWRIIEVLSCLLLIQLKHNGKDQECGILPRKAKMAFCQDHR